VNVDNIRFLLEQGVTGS